MLRAAACYAVCAACGFSVGNVPVDAPQDGPLDAPDAAHWIREAVSAVLAIGHRTADLAEFGGAGDPIGCRRMGDLVVERLEAGA